MIYVKNAIEQSKTYHLYWKKKLMSCAPPMLILLSKFNKICTVSWRREREVNYASG